ncbi:MAG: asnB [Clostridiales bacterium]|jgi:asparagine synthase (glutamine-hydrolysing)|nr:asnB [Clostridiales bacterium]
MCSIAGWVDYRNDLYNNDRTLEKMLETMSNRGPDAQGIYKSREACLLHKRLIVVDPENGKQPMEYRQGDINYILSYNGELYNTEEIRNELIGLGYCFRGHSDTEVLLCSFVEWKEKCLEKLNGIFAFAVWNDRDKRLFFARDRIGVKPLFYYKYNEAIIFASEIKTLLANSIVKPILDRNGLNEIFLLGPSRTQGNGIYKNIEEVKPGEYRWFDKDGITKGTYWSLVAKPHTDNMEQSIENVRQLVCDSIERQLVSDVPLCCFLSGGLDSSIISMVAAKRYKALGKEPLTTYSVDYEGNEKFFKKNSFQPDSDNEYINIMSEFIGSKHKKYIVQNKDLAEALYNAVCARDVPGMVDIDSSLLLFCREIKKDFTVALSGECADEIFGGYPWYHNEEILFEDTFPWSKSLDLRKSILKDGVLAPDADEYVRNRYESTCNETSKLEGESKLESRMREMFNLNFYWFMQTLLDRKDRMSMYSGLEVRVPFCDYRLVEYAYNLPWQIKSGGGREKWILREAMKDLLPEKVVWRKKSPYPKTFDPEYFNIVKNEVNRMIKDKDSFIGNILNKDMIKKLEDNPEIIATPWYGQLMRTPQVFAYLWQIDMWMKKYNVVVE